MERWQLANAAAFGVNTFATFAIGTSSGGVVAHRLGTRTNKELSAKYPTLFTPAGWAFAIWGPIFTLEGASMLWQLLSPSEALRLASPYWVTGCGLQAAWAVAFGMDKTWLSLVFMCGITGALIATYSATAASTQTGLTVSYILGNLPYAMHAAWLVCASLANVNIVAVSSRASAPTQRMLAWVSRLSTCSMGLGLSLYFGDPVFAFVSSWAARAISDYSVPPQLAQCHDSTSLALLSSAAKGISLSLALFGMGLAVYMF